MEDWRIVSNGVGKFRIRDFTSGKWLIASVKTIYGSYDAVYETGSLDSAKDKLAHIRWEVMDENRND